MSHHQTRPPGKFDAMPALFVQRSCCLFFILTVGAWGLFLLAGLVLYLISRWVA